MQEFLGVDTSNYTTSLALSRDGEIVRNLKKLLDVKEGQRGLRQSDAVFHHTRQLPEVLSMLGDKIDGAKVIGVSERPRDAKDSYMPCFLVGIGAAQMLAQALGVPVNQLIDYEEIGEEKGEKGEIIKHNLSKSKYYMYFYDGRRSRIARNVIEVQDGGEDSGVFSANMYASLEDLSNYYQCKLLYHGTMRKGDTFINFNFENQNNKVERMFMYAINSFNNGGRMEGLCCCLSTQPILPACFKFLMVSDILEETDDLKEKLKVSKEDIRLLKKMNMFVVSDHA